MDENLPTHEIIRYSGHNCKLLAHIRNTVPFQEHDTVLFYNGKIYLVVGCKVESMYGKQKLTDIFMRNAFKISNKLEK